MIKLLFLGSDNFPVPIAQEIDQSKRIELVGIVTSRHENNYPKSLTAKVPVFTPTRLSDEQDIILDKTKPDIILVCNYGQFLNEEILKYPKYGCLNIHASLLPKLRGACPIEMAIVRGFSETGITIQKMVKEMDAGDIVFQKKADIDKKETGEDLRKKLQRLAVENVNEVIINSTEGEIEPRTQNAKLATYCQRKDISKEAAKIDWDEPAKIIERKIRAFNPKPTAWSFIKFNGQKKRMKIFSAEIDNKNDDLKSGGTEVETNILKVKTGEGMLMPREVQVEGKKKMGVEEFLRGVKGDIRFM